MRLLLFCTIFLMIARAASAAVAVANASFESPAVSNFEYNPGPTIAEQNGLGWSWGTGSGIARNGGFLPGGVQNAPDGSQAAILQQQSSFSQSLAGISSGLYSFSFYAEGRNFAQGSNPFQVEIDGTPLSFG